jgi:hypothetical protein
LIDKALWFPEVDFHGCTKPSPSELPKGTPEGSRRTHRARRSVVDRSARCYTFNLALQCFVLVKRSASSYEISAKKSDNYFFGNAKTFGFVSFWDECLFTHLMQIAIWLPSCFSITGNGLLPGIAKTGEQK